MSTTKKTTKKTTALSSVTKRATGRAKKAAPKKAAPKKVSGLEAQVYTSGGKSAGTITLSEQTFGTPWNADLVHQVVLAMQANARAGTAHTKDRSEVRGGGRKPWKQKGTGRARHGSRRSPIWTGGGVTFGPRAEKDYSQKLNKNARVRAFASVLSRKYADGEVLFVDALGLENPSAKDAKTVLTALAGVSGYEAIGSKGQNAALVVLPERREAVEKSFRNFGNVAVVSAKDVSSVDLLTYKYIVVAGPKEATEVLDARTALKGARKNA